MSSWFRWEINSFSDIHIIALATNLSPLYLGIYVLLINRINWTKVNRTPGFFGFFIHQKSKNEGDSGYLFSTCCIIDFPEFLRDC